MPAAWGLPWCAILQAARGQRDERGTDAAYRRAVHQVSVFGVPQAGGDAASQRQACAAVDAVYEPASDIPEAEHQQAASGTSHLSIFAQTPAYYPPESGVGVGYYVHPVGAGMVLSGGDTRLVQPVCGGVEAIGEHGIRLLRGGAQRGALARYAGHPQHRSGHTVYRAGVR